MAAASHHKLLFVMRDAQARNDASPAVLRLELWPGNGVGIDVTDDALHVHLLKRRGPPQDQPLQLAARAPRLAMLLAATRPAPYALACTTHRA
jgi:protein ImuA